MGLLLDTYLCSAEQLLQCRLLICPILQLVNFGKIRHDANVYRGKRVPFLTLSSAVCYFDAIQIFFHPSIFIYPGFKKPN